MREVHNLELSDDRYKKIIIISLPIFYIQCNKINSEQNLFQKMSEVLLYTPQVDGWVGGVSVKIMIQSFFLKKQIM